MFSQPSAAALNHLLMQNSWALPRLARFAGKTVRFDIMPFSFVCTILEDGSLQSVEAAISADASCVIAPSLLPLLVLHDENAHAGIRTDGDAELLKEIFFLSRNLRWDAAEDLSSFTGDIMAERLVQTFHSARQQMLDAAVNLSQASAEYLTEERPLIAKPKQVSGFTQQVDDLRDDLARLEQRIVRLFVTEKT
jgi:ubiquinone biosynthesis protein UbiJ